MKKAKPTTRHASPVKCPVLPIALRVGELWAAHAGGTVMALATIPPTPAAAAPTGALDPAFALISEKQAADVAHCAAIDVESEAESVSGFDSDAAWDANERCEAACRAVNAAGWRLATTPPTTLAGVAAVLRFANEIEDAGNEWPDTDTIGPDGWHYQLRATMAAAIETIIREMEG